MACLTLLWVFPTLRWVYHGSIVLPSFIRSFSLVAVWFRSLLRGTCSAEYLFAFFPDYCWLLLDSFPGLSNILKFFLCGFLVDVLLRVDSLTFPWGCPLAGFNSPLALCASGTCKLSLSNQSMGRSGLFILASAFSLWPFLPHILRKLRSSSGTVLTPIAPYWPQRLWFPDLLDLAFALTVPFPLRPRLLSHPRSRHRHRGLLRLRFHTWRLQRFARAAGFS